MSDFEDATPRPWAIDYSDSGPRIYAPTADGGVIPIARVIGGQHVARHAAARDNAALIDAAVNSFDDLREALREMVYEATHLSAPDDAGAHWCKISKAALDAARAALVKAGDP